MQNRLSEHCTSVQWTTICFYMLIDSITSRGEKGKYKESYNAKRNFDSPISSESLRGETDLADCVGSLGTWSCQLEDVDAQAF